MAPVQLKERTSIDRGWASIIMCLLIVTLVVYLVAFAIPYWAWLGSNQNTKTHYGLWQECRSGRTAPIAGCFSKASKQGEEWFMAVQAFGTISLLLLIVALALTISYLCKDGLSESSTASEAILALICCSVCSLIITVMIFGNKHAVNSLSWSFAFAVIALLFDVVAAIITFLAIRKS